MKDFDLSRFKNYGLWLSLLSLIPIILSQFGVNIAPDVYQPLVNSILGILVALGIISDPTTKSKWYADDKKEDK